MFKFLRKVLKKLPNNPYINTYIGNTNTGTITFNTAPGAVNWAPLTAQELASLHAAQNQILTQQQIYQQAIQQAIQPLTVHVDEAEPLIPEGMWDEFLGTGSKTRKRQKMADLEEFYNKKVVSVVPLRGKRQKGLIGLEIEAEGKSLFNTPFKWWSCHEDGSLRPVDGHPPIEYVLKEPLSVKDTKEALQYLKAKLKETGSQVIMSNRTSVHVHVNCQDMTIRQLYCYILLYLIFEEALVDWSGPERAGNLFCMRAKDSDYYIHMLESTLKDKSFKLWREEVRYSACNVSSVPKFGSLEFRSLRGTTDPELIMTWINMLVLLKEESLSYDNPVQIVQEFNQLGPMPFFRKTFKDNTLFNILNQQPRLASKLWDGLRMMRDVAYACPWKAPLPKKADEPEEEALAYHTGMNYFFPWDGRHYTVRSAFCDPANSPNGRAFFIRRLNPENNTVTGRESYILPPQHTLYYVDPPDLHGDYLLLDVVEGVPH